MVFFLPLSLYSFFNHRKSSNGHCVEIFIFLSNSYEDIDKTIYFVGKGKNGIVFVFSYHSYDVDNLLTKQYFPPPEFFLSP